MRWKLKPMRKLDYRPQVHQSGTREQFVTSNQKDSYHKLDLRLFWIESVLPGADFGQNFKYSIFIFYIKTLISRPSLQGSRWSNLWYTFEWRALSISQFISFSVIFLVFSVLFFIQSIIKCTDKLNEKALMYSWAILLF